MPAGADKIQCALSRWIDTSSSITPLPAPLQIDVPNLFSLLPLISRWRRLIYFIAFSSVNVYSGKLQERGFHVYIESVREAFKSRPPRAGGEEVEDATNSPRYDPAPRKRRESMMTIFPTHPSIFHTTLPEPNGRTLFLTPLYCCFI